MSLSRQYLSRHRVPIVFDIRAMAAALMRDCPEVVFAFVAGSGRHGTLAVGSDLDLALYLAGDDKASLALYQRAEDAVQAFVPGAHVDIGILNQAEPVYRFEALKGHRLFARDEEIYLRFYSLTCREYESQMCDYERQYRYRMEAA